MKHLGNTQTPQPTAKRVALTLLALFAAYLLLASSSTLWDRDEPRFARCTVEMVQSGDFLVPTFNGELRPDKPAGIYWLMAAGYKTLGLTELAFRLPSVLGITGAAFLCFLVGRRLFNDRVGYRAMLFYGSAAMVSYMATASTSDGALNGLITLAIWCFVEIIYAGKKLPLLVTMTAALALAQLVKGPVGVAIPVLSMLTMGLMGMKSGAFRVGLATALGVAAAAVISFGAFAAWGIPANIASDGQLLELGMGKHVGERMVSPQERHGGAGIKYILWLPFYLPVIVAALTPWSMHLPGGLSAIISKNLGTAKERAVIWGWILPTFILMSLVATKLPHYILPIFPGLAVLCAAVIDPAHADRLSARDKKMLRYGRFFVAPPIVAAAGGAAAAGWFVPGGEALKLPGILLALTLLGFGTVYVLQTRKGKPQQATRTALVSLPVALLIVCFGLLPAVEAAFKPSKPMAQALREAGLPQDAPVIMCDIQEPSMVFYLDRAVDQPVTLLCNPEQVLAWAKQPGPGAFILKTQRLEQIEQAVGPLPLKRVYESGVLQYSDMGESSHLIALMRGNTKQPED